MPNTYKRKIYIFLKNLLLEIWPIFFNIALSCVIKFNLLIDDTLKSLAVVSVGRYLNLVFNFVSFERNKGIFK